MQRNCQHSTIAPQVKHVTPGCAPRPVVCAPPFSLSDWVGAHPPGPGTPVCIVLHGLTGGSHEVYVQHMVAALLKHDITPVVMNARGCGGTRLQTPRVFSAAFTLDIRTTVTHVRGLVGAGAPLFAVGFSLGAIVLSKYLCEEGENAPLTASACLCASYCMRKTTTKLETGYFRGALNRVLAGNLIRFMWSHQYMEERASFMSFEEAATAKTVRDFDRAVIVPMFGYENEWEYYRYVVGAKSPKEQRRQFCEYYCVDMFHPSPLFQTRQHWEASAPHCNSYTHRKCGRRPCVFRGWPAQGRRKLQQASASGVDRRRQSRSMGDRHVPHGGVLGGATCL
jgi:pimeloyl-ACP methyl ester carboxylesterase